MAECTCVSLPNEILVKIFSYLSSEALLKIYKNCENKELQRLLTDRSVLSVVDFCEEECTASTKDLTRFLLALSVHTKAICLNHCGSKLLSQKNFFLNWDYLTELHVKDCGFSLSSVVNLVPDLNSLQALSWSLLQVPHKEWAEARKRSGKSSQSVKNIDLDVSFQKASLTLIVLRRFPKISHLHINMYFQKTLDSSSPFPREQDLSPIFTELHTCTLTVVGHDYIFNHPNFFVTFCNYVALLNVVINSRNRDLKWHALEAWEKCSSEYILETTERPCAPPANSKKRIFWPCDTLLIDSNLRYLDDVVSNNFGDQLTHVAIVSWIITTPYKSSFLNALTRLISLSSNLREINLTGSHLGKSQNTDDLRILEVIAQAHGLQRLAIPGCYIPTVHVEKIYHRKRMKVDIDKECPGVGCTIREEIPSLEQLVRGCPRLLELDIRNYKYQPLDVTIAQEHCSCTEASESAREEDLLPISKMLKLEDLTLKGLRALNKLEMLKDISSSCRYLKTLRLAELGPQPLCLYLQSLYLAIPNLTRLQELSLEHHHLPLDDARFWQALSNLHSLKRLCLISGFQRALKPQPITQFFLKAQNVRTVHIHSRATNFKISHSTITSALKKDTVFMKRRVPYDLVIENLNETKGKPGAIPVYSGNFYECQRLCLKNTTVGIPVNRCGL